MVKKPGGLSLLRWRGSTSRGLRVVLETWFGFPTLSSHPDANFTSDFIHMQMALGLRLARAGLVVVGLLKSARFLFCCDCDASLVFPRVVVCGVWCEFLGPSSLLPVSAFSTSHFLPKFARRRARTRFTSGMGVASCIRRLLSPYSGC